MLNHIEVLGRKHYAEGRRKTSYLLHAAKVDLSYVFRKIQVYVLPVLYQIAQFTSVVPCASIPYPMQSAMSKGKATCFSFHSTGIQETKYLCKMPPKPKWLTLDNMKVQSYTFSL